MVTADASGRALGATEGLGEAVAEEADGVGESDGRTLEAVSVS
ncbi:hypothetical protein ACIQCF_33395 [Streptomyces sp. NPDC088353]